MEAVCDTDIKTKCARERERGGAMRRYGWRQCGKGGPQRDAEILNSTKVYPSIVSGSAPGNRPLQDPRIRGACADTLVRSPPPPRTTHKRLVT